MTTEVSARADTLVGVLEGVYCCFWNGELEVVVTSADVWCMGYELWQTDVDKIVLYFVEHGALC